MTIGTAPNWYLVLYSEDGAKLVAAKPDARVFLSLDEDGQISCAESAVPHGLASLQVKDESLWLHPSLGHVDVWVNGDALERVALLAPGDVISAGKGALVVSHRPESRRPNRVMRMADLVGRLRQETERSLRYGSPLTVMVLRMTPPSGHQAQTFCDLITRATRSVDLMAWDGGPEAVFVFPETGSAASVPADRLLAALAPLDLDPRAGLVSCPSDGSDARALMAGARAAAEAAGPGEVRWLGSLEASLTLGGRAVVAVDPSMQSLLEQMRGLAPSNLPVLLQGETGVGKDVVARLIHKWSSRASGPLVSVNCGAIAETLLEGELFGYEKGAFTGANATRPGLIESADGGTLFLDELGESSSRMQVELLRVLDSGRVRRIGSSEERPCDVRLIAATNRDLDEEVKAGRFRRDLMYRLNAATLRVPSLRERLLDLPVMARTFLAEACERDGRPAPEISPGTMQRLLLHDWPGNVRELKNLIEYLTAVVATSAIEPDQLPDAIGARTVPWLIRSRAPHAPAPAARSSTPSPGSFRKTSEEVAELECKRMAQALDASAGVRVRAAELIGMPLRTFLTKLKRYGLAEATAPGPRQSGA